MIPLSVLDLSPITEGSDAAQSLRNTLDLARHAERWGYHRFWLAEHHGMPGIASAATAVVIAHVAAGTSTIRVGAGGIMLPNHSPLVIAEQFGTLESLFPGRIDLGLGRAPGSDQTVARALRRGPMAAESFPEDVGELLEYFRPAEQGQLVRAVPGAGLDVPVWILGSSLFGARLAAAFGLPYAFASHFAPQMLEAAVAAYRREFRPSDQLDRPYVIAGVNVLAADTTAQAQEQLQVSRRFRATALFGRGQTLTDEQADELLAQGAAHHVDKMLTYAAIGTPAEVGEYLDGFVKQADADELIVAHQFPGVEGRLRSVELTAEAMATVAA
jgi:luciferase family oxidoreductase group 1